jgi:septation ring formation regulator EzrA
MKKLTAEAYNFKKTASEFDSVVNAFDDVDSKVIKTTKDLESLKDTASKAKELLSNMNSKDRLNDWQKF